MQQPIMYDLGCAVFCTRSLTNKKCI